jgi:hypothetical protein
MSSIVNSFKRVIIYNKPIRTKMTFSLQLLGCDSACWFGWWNMLNEVYGFRIIMH